MSGRSPRGTLMIEHRIIERMLVILRREIDSIAENGPSSTRGTEGIVADLEGGAG